MFRDLTMSKAQRSSQALHTAARLAEHRKKWYSAAELCRSRRVTLAR
ncbi:hypothetical protein [Pseudomonas putida]|nr:hypothetical protein [Pseudomonas putida]MCZ9640989.1 hypothetical protein [Pseudomonas putida]